MKNDLTPFIDRIRAAVAMAREDTEGGKVTGLKLGLSEAFALACYISEHEKDPTIMLGTFDGTQTWDGLQLYEVNRDSYFEILRNDNH